MKHTNSKFFIMFLAGILFSAITVFAATVNVSTNFTSNAVQFLQQLVLTDASGTTGVVLDGTDKKIQVDRICETDGSGCKLISDLFTGSDTDTHLTTGDVNNMETDPVFMLHSGDYLTSYTETDPVFMAHSGDYLTSYTETDPVFMAHSGDYLTGELWNTGTPDSINYTAGNVGIGTSSPTTKLDVAGTGTFDNIISESSIKLGPKLTCDVTTRGSIRYKEGNSDGEPCNDSIELCVLSSGSYDWIQIVSAADTPDGNNCQMNNSSTE